MTILQINKFFNAQGGADKHYLALINLLQGKGHKVVPFCMKNPVHFRFSTLDPQLKKLYLQYKKYFVSYVDFGRPCFKNFVKIFGMFWSFEAGQKVAQLISTFNSQKSTIDIAHLHNIYHQISPSILPVLKKHNIPVVMTVHDLHLVSPLYSENFLEKSVCSLEIRLHKKVYQKYIDLFFAPSEFVRAELIRAGFAQDKIKVLPLFLSFENKEKIQSQQTSESKSQRTSKPINLPTIIYFGRLAPEKGVDILIKAMQYVKTPVKLLIAGQGLERELIKLTELIKRLRLGDKIKFLGYQEPQSLNRSITQSLFTLFPSRVPETFGLGVLESFAQARPVIGPRSGAIPELIEEGRTGLLFEPQSAHDLAKKIDLLLARPWLCAQMGKTGWQKARTFSKNQYYQKLISFYKKLL